jgi:hypothetical protein
MGKNITAIGFCVLTLAATVAISWVAFPYAAMSHEALEAAQTPTDAEEFDDVNIKDFGEIPVFDMVLHYIDNPPVDTGEAEPTVRFQGC